MLVSPCRLVKLIGDSIEILRMQRDDLEKKEDDLKANIKANTALLCLTVDPKEKALLAVTIAQEEAKARTVAEDLKVVIEKFKAEHMEMFAVKEVIRLANQGPQ